MSGRPASHRSESARARRDALLRAAVEIAGEEGPGAATHRSVAARAGLPPATTSYFFASITELMLEALRGFVEERTEELRGLTPAELPAAVLGSDRVAELALIEAYLHAARDVALRPAVAEAMAAFESVAEVALAAAGAREPAEGARAFQALADGFTLQHLANPRPDDEEALRRAFAALFRAYL